MFGFDYKVSAAYNLAISTSVDFVRELTLTALYPPKRFFGAPNFEEGGSITIIGTALVDTLTLDGRTYF